MGRDLYGVIRYRKWEVDEKRLALARLVEEEGRIVEDLRRLGERLKAEAKAASQDAMGAGVAFAPYAARARTRREDLEAGLMNVRRTIEAARDALAEAFKELKAFEVAQENRDAETRRALERKAQGVQDDLAQELHRRKSR